MRPLPPPGYGWLVRGCGALVLATTALIVLGALVRANGAGLACPDWPLCFGEAIPTFDLKVGFEMTHRYVAGAVGLFYLVLGAWLLRDETARRAAGGLWGAGAVLLGVQVVLGALTVWELLAAWTVTSHLLTGNAFNACLLMLTLELRDARRGARPGPLAPGPVRAGVGLAAALLAFQMFLGGWVASSYAGMACPEWPTCNGGEWFPAWRGAVGLHLLHRMNGYALAVSICAAAWLARKQANPRPWLAIAVGLILVQIGVGVANVLTGMAVEITGLHSALAALLVLTLAAAVRASFWPRSVSEESA